MILFYILILFNLAFGQPSDLDKKSQNSEAEVINLIPRIKLIEKNSLKSYSWWQEENPKYNKNFKLLLLKLKESFLKDKIDLKYKMLKIENNELEKLENYVVLTADLVLDAKNPNEAKLIDLVFYKIHQAKVKTLFVSKSNDLNLNSNFDVLVSDFKLNSQKGLETITPVVESDGVFFIIEAEMGFEDLSQIKELIKTELKIDDKQVVLFSTETGKYTFKIYKDISVFEKLKTLNYVKGPYKFEVSSKSLILKPYQESDFKNDEL